MILAFAGGFVVRLSDIKPDGCRFATLAALLLWWQRRRPE